MTQWIQCFGYLCNSSSAVCLYRLCNFPKATCLMSGVFHQNAQHGTGKRIASIFQLQYFRAIWVRLVANKALKHYMVKT
jgi:hypothetical protein